MADVELLPLPEWTKRDDLGGLVPSQVRAGMRDYARANMEPLLAEVAEWKRVAAAQAELHGEAEDRADRLAKTLRSSADALERLAFAIPAPNTHTPQLVELAIAMRAAALAQEDRND